MANDQDTNVLKVATSGAVVGMGLINFGRLDKRTFVSALLGAALGFGLSITFYGLWNALVKSFNRHKQSEQFRQMNEQLTSIKAELLVLRNEIYHSNLKASNNKHDVETLPYFMLDDDTDSMDDYEKFLDVENDDDDLNSASFKSAKSPTEVLSSANSFHSVSSHLSNDYSYCDMKVRVPTNILEEIDELADYALGEYSSSELQINPSGDSTTPGMQAYARCLVYRYKYRYCPEFLWRLARATYIASEEASSDEVIQETDMLRNKPASESSHSSRNLNDIACEVQSRKQFIESGIKCARRALSIIQKSNLSLLDDDPIKLAPIYKWLAILVGVYSSYVSAQQRIQYGYEFKELIDTAIKLDASDALSYYLQGRWCYEVYNLSWIERQIASKLFSKPPTSTIEEANTAFEKAEKLRPNHYAALYLYRAKCFISTSDYKTALHNLKIARNLFAQHRHPTPHTDTGSIREQVDQLYNKYCRYL